MSVEFRLLSGLLLDNLCKIVKSTFLHWHMVMPVNVRREIHIGLRNLTQQWVLVSRSVRLNIYLWGPLEVPRQMQTSLILLILELLVHGS